MIMGKYGRPKNPHLARHNNHANICVVLRQRERPAHLEHRPRPKGIVDLRPVDGDARDALRRRVVFDVHERRLQPDFSPRRKVRADFVEPVTPNPGRLPRPAEARSP